MNSNRRVLVTGASGFLGSNLLRCISLSDTMIGIGSVRTLNESTAANMVAIGDIDKNTDWSSALDGQDVVVHAAARAHVLRDIASDSAAEFRKVNVEGTLNLARQAAASGIRRFVFISSIGVNGGQNCRPFNENDPPEPVGAYAQSKWEAEQKLWNVANETDMELVIVRPPLVYGPGAPGNFSLLVSWVSKGIPLPLGAVVNRRTFVALDNLTDLVVTCIDHPNAANQVFLAGDGEDLSTSDLLQRVAEAMGKPSRLIPVPVKILNYCALLLGKKTVAQQLLGSLQVDISKAQELLGWNPPVSVDEGLRRCFKTKRD